MENIADKTVQLPEFDEPLLLGEEARAPIRWLTLLASLAASMVLLACLVAQMLYFYPDYFLRHPVWRPVIENACEQLSCTVSPEKNAAALRSNFLSVDPHTEYQDMLVLKFRAQNTAMYPLAYPAVEVLFSNTENSPVAARRFYPGHYLPVPELHKGFIAAGAEIDGSIVVQSPGADAVNYRLEFVYENN